MGAPARDGPDFGEIVARKNEICAPLEQNVA
jgi:hypothetical protein